MQTQQKYSALLQTSVLVNPGECKELSLARTVVRTEATGNYTVPIMGGVSVLLEFNHTDQKDNADLESSPGLWYNLPAHRLFANARVGS